MANLPVPETKIEHYLDKLAGESPTLPVPETKTEAYLKKIAENGSLPSTEEASAGDVLSLDEERKPTWAPSSGGGGDMLILTPTDHTITPGATYSTIYLCPFSTISSLIDQETGAVTKPLFINVPTIVSLADTEWEDFEGLVFCGELDQLLGEKAFYSYGSIDVFLEVEQSGANLIYHGR